MAFLFDCYHYFRCKGENYRNGGLLLSSRFSHRLSQRGGKLKLKKRYSEHVFSFVLHNAGNVSHMLRLKDNSYLKMLPNPTTYALKIIPGTVKLNKT